ncbi:MAG: metal-dependent hydrolase [Polyangiaceae bacterium]|nr:metal-dependent hydrolase [Polyangiaceae bacterium]
MDNITHSLVGLLVAEACWVRLQPKASGESTPTPVQGSSETQGGKRIRALLCGTSLVANNFPDLDFLYTNITYGKIGYLLHHRGHTHTFPLALVQGLVVLGLGLLLARWLKLALTASQRFCLGGLAILGPFLHICMDFLNNYGVHPFWPMSNQWVYGDTLFIIEPYLILTLCSFLVWSMHTRVARGLLFAIILLIVAACWAFPYVNFLSAQLVTALALIMLWLSYAWSRTFRVIAAGGLSVLIILVFSVGSRSARALTDTVLRDTLKMEVEDVVATPHPANPLCYDVLGVGTAGADYVLTYASVSVLPAWVSPRSCRALRTESSLPMEPVDVQTEATLLRAIWRTPLARLRERFSSNCISRDFLRFARAPFLLESNSAWAVGDLRYDMEKGSGFAEIPLPQGVKDCPKFVPPWVPPRGKLLLTPE